MRQTDYSGHNPGMTLLSRGWWARGRGGYATLAVIAAAAIAFFVCQWLLPTPPASASNPEAPLSVTPELVFSVGEIPDSIALGESVDLEFQISLRSGTGGHGGISVSFHDLTARGGNSSSYDSVQGTVTTISYTNGSSHVAYFDEGDQIFKGNDANRSSAKYLLVESDDDDWPSRSGSDYVWRTLKLRVTPKEPGAFLIYSRFWLCGNGYEDCDRRPRPEHSDQEDQQRWSVYEDTVEVSGPTSGPFSRNSAEDFDGLYEAENDDPEGIWSDGTTMWVADSSDSKIYAYNISNKARVSSKDFDTLDSAGNDHPRGIWSDGTTMWVADSSDDKIYAYNMSNKARVSSKDFDTLDSAGNDHPRGIWSDGATMWVADYSDDKIYAYNMSNKARVSSKDFDTLEGAENDHPAGIWSDGATMWVADYSDDKIYAYNISDKARVSSKDFDTLEGAKNDHPRGIWSDRTTMWVADYSDEKIYAYRAPEMAPAPTQNQNRSPSVSRVSPSSALVSLYTGDRQTFTARATDPDNNLKSYSWFVKDRSEESSPFLFGVLPTGSATDDFSHTFGTAGPYTVKATFTDKGGLSDSVSWTVVVRDPNRAPSVVRGSPYTESVSLETGDRQAFTANASDPDNNLRGYEWFVGDVFGDAFVWQTPPTGFASGSFSHTFSTEGTFIVEASFTDTEGLSGSVTWTVTVTTSNRAPSVSRVSPSSALVSLYTGDRQTFTARATDPDNNLKSYSWFVKDRSEESSPFLFGVLPTGSATDDFSHTFGTAGPYTVKATFTDKGGLSDSVSWTVVVRDPNRPSVDRVSPTQESLSLETGDSQSFTVRATDADNDLTKWKWVADWTGFGLAGHIEPEASFALTGDIPKTFSYTFDTTGTWTVTATFTDSRGEFGSAAWTVEVTDGPDLSIEISLAGLAVVDQGVWVTTIVQNIGDERSAPFDLVFDLRSADENTGTSTEPHKLQSTFEVVAFLDPGDSSEQRRTAVAMPNIASGEHRLCASLDFGGLAFDTDESNYTDCTLIFLLRHSSDLSKFDRGQSLVFPDLRIIPSLPPGFDFYFNHIFPLTAGVNKALAGACALGLLGHEGERFWVQVPEEIDVFAARRIIGASGMCHHAKRVDLYGRLAYELALRDQLEPESHMTSFDVLETGNEVFGATAEYLDLLDTAVEISLEGAGAAFDLGGSGLVPHASHFVQHAGPVLSSVKFGTVQADIILSAMADHGINVATARKTLEELSALQMDSAWSEGIAVAGDDVDELTSDNFWVRYVAQTKQNSDEVLTSGVSLSFAVAGVIVKGGAIAGIKLNPAGLVVAATLLATLETLDHWKDLSLSLAAAQVYATMYDPDATGHDLEVQTYAKFLVYDHLYKSRSGNWMTWLSDHLKFNRGDRDLFLDDVSELRDEAFAEAAATVKLAEIEVEPSSLSVSAEETVCLKPTLITASGRRDSVRGDALSCGRVTIGGLTWTSSDTAVVSVSDRGRVQALSPGTATIIVTSGEISGTATVEVTPRVSCADGGAVADAANTGLVADCEALLAARDTLGGEPTLTWSYDTPITEWDGVTLGGTPSRVTGLDLEGEDLDGTIPAVLEALAKLEQLDLRSNMLTGPIPEELESLVNLRELRLSGNQLTGCIPSGLRNIQDNDLGRLGLPFCDMPGAPTIATPIVPGDVALTVAWAAPINTGSSAITAYDLRYIETGAADKSDANWTVVEDVWAAGSGSLQYTLSGLTGGTQYDVQMRAVNAAGASAWSSSAIGTLATWGAIRSFSPPSAALGGEVVVTVTASGYGPFGGIMETLPAGFSYVSSSLPDDSVTVNGQEVTFSLLGETDFTYTVAAPSAEGSYSFSGVLTNSDRAEVPVGGAITIAVTTGDPLIARYDANGNSMIERGEVIAAINDYIFGEGDGVISRSDVIRLITLYIFAPSTPHNRPGAPTGLTAVGNGQTRIDLSWSAPPSDGGSAITGYRIEVSENGSTWIDLVANTRNPATSYSHTGLTAGSTRHYRVSAINSAGTGPVSNIATGTAAGDAATDRAALVALYNATDGANWLNNGNWLSNAPMGEWHGVTTDSDGRVTQLILDNNQLTGEISAELGSLPNLQFLRLQGNRLTGCIPAGLRNVPDNDLDELGLDDCVSAAASGESKASFQNFHVIDVELDEYGDHDRECRTRLGSKYRLADWNDLKDYYTSGGSIPELIAGLNWKDENTSDVGVRGPRVARNGEVRFGSRRHYFVSRHDHAPPGYFLVHDDIDDYHLSLGSWYGQGGEALCYKTG